MTATGERGRSWTFAPRVIAPAATAIVVAEATWASLLAAAVANASFAGHVSLPFLALALPGAAAVGFGTAGVRRGGRRRRRLALLTAGVVLGAALTAGVIGELTRSGWLWRVAIDPWTANGHGLAVTAAAAWAVAVLAWGRGVWLGADPPSFRHTAWSVGLGGVAFIGVVIGRAEGNHTPFSAATGATGWLLLVWFAFAAMALALVRERDLEQEILHHSQSRPDREWLTVLAGPVLAVALVALFIAVALGPAATAIGHALALAGGAIAWLITAIAHGISDLVHPAHGHGQTAHLSNAHHKKATATHQRHTVTVLSHKKDLGRKPGDNSTTAWLAVAVAVPLTFVILAIVYLLPHRRPRRRRRPLLGDVAEDEQRDSVFTWRHLASQVKGALRALLERLRQLRWRRRSRRASAPSVATIATAAPDDDTGPESVRRAYRRMLITARASGSGRAAAETTREFQGRLSDGPAADEAGALATLTALYDAARYGEMEIEEPERVSAVNQADAISSTLREHGVEEQTLPPTRPKTRSRAAARRR
jgi:Domain of unknown function (DUF4129)